MPFSRTRRPATPNTAACQRPPSSAHMHAAGGITHVVRQIDLCSLAEIDLRQGSITEPGSDEGIERRTQRTAMCRSRLVVAEIGLVHCDRPIVPQQRAQCHHVSLLDRLRATDAFRSEAWVSIGIAEVPLCSHIDLLELEVPCKLLEELGSRDRNPLPVLLPARATIAGSCSGETQGRTAQPLPVGDLLALKDVDDIGRALQVKDRHRVCVRIVVDHFVIFVGTDHLPDMGATIGFDLRPDSPRSVPSPRGSRHRLPA